MPIFPQKPQTESKIFGKPIRQLLKKPNDIVSSLWQYVGLDNRPSDDDAFKGAVFRLQVIVAIFSNIKRPNGQSVWTHIEQSRYWRIRLALRCGNISEENVNAFLFRFGCFNDKEGAAVQTLTLIEC